MNAISKSCQVCICSATLSGLHLQMGCLLLHLFSSIFCEHVLQNTLTQICVIGRIHVCVCVCVFGFMCFFIFACLQCIFPLTRSLVMPTVGSCLFLVGCAGGAANHFVIHIRIRRSKEGMRETGGKTAKRGRKV